MASSLTNASSCCANNFTIGRSLSAFLKGGNSLEVQFCIVYHYLLRRSGTTVAVKLWSTAVSDFGRELESAICELWSDEYIISSVIFIIIFYLLKKIKIICNSVKQTLNCVEAQ